VFKFPEEAEAAAEKILMPTSQLQEINLQTYKISSRPVAHLHKKTFSAIKMNKYVY
jgi:hypothetical protein